MSSSKKTSASAIVLNAVQKIRPEHLLDNPMLAIIFVIACIATILFLSEINFPTGHIALYGQMIFWIWMTLFFSTLADSFAESKLGDKNVKNTQKRTTQLIKTLKNIDDFDDVKEVEYSSIKSGDLILLNNNDVIPFDGILLKGKCYTNETNITGEVGSVLKTPEKNSVLTSGSIVEGTDFIIMKVSFARKFSFFARVQKILKGINRQSLPSELALQRIIMGLSILFISVIFTVWVIARYSGFAIPPIYLLDLIVILLPTTISGLQHSIITFGKAKLKKSEIIVHDHIALDNVVDVNIILLDKTGTLTHGKREMTDFEVTGNMQDKEYMEYLFLSSLYDSTYEGISIKSYAKKRNRLKEEDIDKNLYQHLEFSASKPISGCNYKNLEIRKGSVKAISRYLGKSVKKLPKDVLNITQSIAKAHGTPVLLSINKKIVGVIHLRDRFRKGIMKQVKKLHDEAVNTILITGDNALTASYVAQKIGIKDSYAEATPEKKLELIRNLQQEGYVVAMCGDGANDALALAQADIGFTFQEDGNVHSIMAGNIIAKNHDLSALIELKNICKKMAVRRGALTVFSLASDIAKYFVIVPALFTTAFPPLSVLNFMHFQSLESVVLASVMFNALVILGLTPVIFTNFKKPKSRYSLWRSILLYGVGGLISPFIGIKLLEIFIHNIGLL